MEAIRRYSKAQSPDHLNTGIARIKLGRALLRQLRYREAEVETLAGYTIVAKQSSPSVSWLNAARGDLVEEYRELKQLDKAEHFQKELAAVKAK
jgi:serine/threonine-protein kinase